MGVKIQRSRNWKQKWASSLEKTDGRAEIKWKSFKVDNLSPRELNFQSEKRNIEKIVENWGSHNWVRSVWNKGQKYGRWWRSV